jgi:hypothetical protein
LYFFFLSKNLSLGHLKMCGCYAVAKWDPLSILCWNNTIIDYLIPTNETRSDSAKGFAKDEVIAYATHTSSFVTTSVCSSPSNEVLILLVYFISYFPLIIYCISLMSHPFSSFVVLEIDEKQKESRSDNLYTKCIRVIWNDIDSGGTEELIWF